MPYQEDDATAMRLIPGPDPTTVEEDAAFSTRATIKERLLRFTPRKD